MLANIKVIVLPDSVSVSKANEAFDGDGALRDEKLAAAVGNLGKTLTETITRLRG
jgi:hypothetical protein